MTEVLHLVGVVLLLLAGVALGAGVGPGGRALPAFVLAAAGVSCLLAGVAVA